MAGSLSTRSSRTRSKAAAKKKHAADADFKADSEIDTTPSAQIEELAFTTTGWAYEHGIVDREESLEITAYLHSSTNYAIKLKEWEEQKHNPFVPPRPSLRSTELESQAAAIEVTRGRPIGMRRPVETIKRTEELPLRVVVPITDELPAGGCKLYVLINPKDGLCTPYQCNQKQVFYLREYRDNEGSAEVRKTSWNRRIQLVSVRCTKSAPSAKQKKFARAQESLKAIVDPIPDFRNDVVHLTASFALYRRPEILKLLKKKLELFDKDLAERPLPSCPNLRFFIQRDQAPRPSSPGSAEVMYDDTAFGAEQAQGVVDEAADQWEDVKLTVQAVLFLRKGLIESGIALEYRFLRGFLAHGSDMFHKALATSTQVQIKQAKDNMEVSTPEEEAIAIPDLTKEGLEDQKRVAVNAKDLVIEVYGNVERVIGYAGLSRLSIEKDVYGALMSSTIKRLKNIVTTAKKFTEDLRGLNGDQLCGDTLPDIWESFNNSIDLDLAKATFGQAVRYAIAELASANIDLGDMVEEVASQLSNLGLEV